MAQLTSERIRKMPLAEVEAELRNAVGVAAFLIEACTMAGRSSGDGFRAALKIGDLAVKELRSQWNNRAEVEEQEKKNPLRYVYAQ